MMFEELIKVLERLDAWGNPCVKIERNGIRDGERYWLVRVHYWPNRSNQAPLRTHQETDPDRDKAIGKVIKALEILAKLPS